MFYRRAEDSALRTSERYIPADQNRNPHIQAQANVADNTSNASATIPPYVPEDVAGVADGPTEGSGEQGKNVVGPLDDMSKDDISYYARYFARCGGVFTPIGDIAETGSAWDDECRDWTGRRRLGLLADPRDISLFESLYVSTSNAVTVRTTDCNVYLFFSRRKRKVEGWIILCEIVPNMREAIQHYLVQGMVAKRLVFLSKVNTVNLISHSG